MLKQFNFKIVAFLLVYSAIVNCDSFPNTVPRCKYADVKCLQNIMNKMIHSSPGGVPEIGLGPIDPLYIGKTVMEQGAPTSPVNVKIRMKNATMTGIKDFDVIKVIGFEKNPNTTRFEIHGYCPKVTVLGNYQMSGKALVVPVNGRGAATIKFSDIAVRMKFNTHAETRNDEVYVVLDQVLYDSTAKRKNKTVTETDWIAFIKHEESGNPPLFKVNCKAPACLAIHFNMSMNFDNLFNDRLISDNMNKFFNDNQDILYKEIGPAMDVVFGSIIKKKVEPIFNKFPYREFFLD